MSLVTLVSGGIDSTLMSLMAHEEGVAINPLFVDYGQLASSKEWGACQFLHNKYGLPKVTRMDLSGFGHTIPSGLTNSAMRINEDAFLPGRNLLLILCGAAYAYRIQAQGVAIGFLNPINRLFPDQSREFLKHCEVMVKSAMGRRISILAPFFQFNKRDILDMAQARGLLGTYSCHSGGDTPCGICVACMEIVSATKERS